MEVRPIKKISGDARRLRRGKIALLIADHEASAYIYRIPLKQSSNHPRLRLTAVAEDTVTLNQALGVMWAKFERIDMRAHNSKFTRHPFVQIPNMPLLVKPPRNP